MTTYGWIQALERMPKADVERLAWGSGAPHEVRHLALMWLCCLDHPRDVTIRAAWSQASLAAVGYEDIDLGPAGEREPGEEG